MIIASDDKRVWGDSGELRCVTDVFGGGGGGSIVLRRRVGLDDWSVEGFYLRWECFNSRLAAALWRRWQPQAAAICMCDQIILCPVTVIASTRND